MASETENGKRKPGRPVRVNGGLQVFGATRVVVEAEGKGGTAGRWVMNAPEGTLDVILELGEGGRPERVRITREGFVARQFLGDVTRTAAPSPTVPASVVERKKRAPIGKGEVLGFFRWMVLTQIDRADLVGQLARHMRDDASWPRKGYGATREAMASYAEGLDRLPEHRGHKVPETFAAAWKEYEAARTPKVAEANAAT